VTETPEEPDRTEEEPEMAPPSEDGGADAPAGESEEQSTRPSSSGDTTPEASETAASETAAEENLAASESEQAAPDVAADRAPSRPPGEAAEGAPSTATAGAAGSDESEPGVVDEAPRAKPEIPGADLEVLLPEEEQQYLDAEAQAAAEAEAEAAAERARAEAEDEQARPIADAAIDLGAGARYTATGKRKTSVARVILKPGAGEYSINGKPLDAYFPRETLQRMIRQPLETVGYEARMDVVARMHGGGVSSQAGALRHGIARALIEADPNLRGELKRRGYLTRDPRVKERKKAGLKKARKRPQFSKR
jgi:small subunit ribosomal protein S9